MLYSEPPHLKTARVPGAATHSKAPTTKVTRTVALGRKILQTAPNPGTRELPKAVGTREAQPECCFPGKKSSAQTFSPRRRGGTPHTWPGGDARGAGAAPLRESNASLCSCPKKGQNPSLPSTEKPRENGSYPFPLQRNTTRTLPDCSVRLSLLQYGSTA